MATIRSFVDATFFVRIERLTDCRNPDDVVIGWVDFDGTNVAGLAQSNMRPRLPAVDRFVHAFANDYVAAKTIRPCADIHDVGVVLRHVNITD